MSVRIKWNKVSLGAKAGFLDRVAQTAEAIIGSIPESPGIYVFARKFGNTLEPMYIGRTLNLRSRIKRQFNNLNLMSALGEKKSLNGERILLIGPVKAQPGLKLSEAIKVAELAHIEHALTQGSPLLNIQGTKTLKHAVAVVPPMAHGHPFPRLMYLSARISRKKA